MQPHVIAAILGVVWMPYSPVQTDLLHRFGPPSATHPLETDAFGRDLLSRILAGASVWVLICFMTVFVAVVGGVVPGSAAGYLGGAADRLIMMVIAALMAFPGLLLALSLMVILGPSKWGASLRRGLPICRR